VHIQFLEWTLTITRNGTIKKLRNSRKRNRVSTEFILSPQVTTSIKAETVWIFFKKVKLFLTSDYKIRNVLIDYFTTKDTLNPKRDQRFIYTN